MFHLSNSQKLNNFSIANTSSYSCLSGCLLILMNLTTLQQLRVVEEAHSMFVTGLEWLPTQNKASQMVRGYSDASVLSISCDNSLKIHHIPRPGMNECFNDKK